MSNSDAPIPHIGPDLLRLLRRYAGIFDTLATQIPAPPGERYTATEFVDWLQLEEHMRSPEEVRHRMREGHQVARQSRQLRMASG